MSSDSSSAKSAPSTSIEKSSVNDLHPEIDLERLPRHVAIIMDGNGRWAARRDLPREEGHRVGARAVRKIVTRAREVGVKHLTLYAFSAQNWRRPLREVAQLMALLVGFCETERRLLLEKNIRFRIIGQRSRLPVPARGAVELLERITGVIGEVRRIHEKEMENQIIRKIKSEFQKNSTRILRKNIHSSGSYHDLPLTELPCASSQYYRNYPVPLATT